MGENNLTLKETKELLEFGFALQEGIVKSLNDGKLNILDVPSFFKAALKAPAAIGGINLVGPELLDLQPEEKEALVVFAKEYIDLPDDELELLIEDTVEQVLNLYQLALRWKNK